jgi:hypothetical protein
MHGETMGFLSSQRLLKSTIFLTAWMIFGPVHDSQATMACPVRLSNGKLDQGKVNLSFMNKGKVPIRQLELYCAPLKGPKAKRLVCHTESGVFFPGTPYTLSFAYPGKTPPAMEISLKTVILPDGTLWTATHDEPCTPLKILGQRQ